MEHSIGSHGSVLDNIALMVDHAQVQSDEAGLRRAIQRCNEVERDLPPAKVPVLLYFRANAYGALLAISSHRHEWSWRNPELEAQIFNLRRAVAHEAFGELVELRRLQILTNLANGLNELGRSIEALEIYDNALAVSSKFGMALGNRGLARGRFARSLWVKNHHLNGMMLAREDLEGTQSADVLWDGSGYSDAKKTFTKHPSRIGRATNVDTLRTHNGTDSMQIGRSKVERAYRSWALRNRLFLSPLNVFSACANGARDCLTLPRHRAKLHDPPQYIAWFNSIVQEFILARLLLYEGTVPSGDHFADRGVTLIDTLDYPAYSISIAKMCLSFRSAYSLLDKIAGFLNAYMDLRINPQQVTIRRLWYDKQTLRQQFETRSNWQLRGLYWLSRDLVDEQDEDANSALEPDGGDLKKLRNALEHRCVTLRYTDHGNDMGIVEATSLEAFAAKALKLVKLVRAAITHLALAVDYGERDRNKKESGLWMGAYLPSYRRRGI
jgi:LA2681-like HEPN